MSKGSGTETYYDVECRYNFSTPMVFGDFVITDKWTQLPRGILPPGAIGGIPSGGYDFSGQRDRLNVMSYQAAMALAWMAHAQVNAGYKGGGICFETRIVKNEVKYSYEMTRISEHCHVHGDDRSNCLPDWGKKEEPKQAQASK